MEDKIKKINSGYALDYDEAVSHFQNMVSGTLTESQIASTLIAMKHRGETVDELAAVVTVLNSHKKRFVSGAERTVDTCGTGGDGKSTVNISTAVSVILASMGHNVVKHGNTAQSGKVGSADILTSLGMDLSYEGTSPEDFFLENNFIFMLATAYHPALKGIGMVRREIRVPTIFNFVGPLVNPADPEYQVIGINRMDRLDFIAGTLEKLGRDRVTVYSSHDAYDEVSSKAKTECVEIRDGRKRNFSIDPGDFFDPFNMPVVHDEAEARKLFIDGISGADEQVAKIFSLNTALALYTMGENELPEGYERTMDQIKSGSAREKLYQITGNGRD